MVAVHQLAQVLGGDLGDAVDVARDRRDVLGDPRGGRARRRRQRAAERARRAREDERARRRRRRASSSRFSVPVTLVSTNSWRLCEPTCGLCSVAACSTASTPSHAAAHERAVGDRADDVVYGDGQDVEARRVRARPRSTRISASPRWPELPVTRMRMVKG